MYTDVAQKWIYQQIEKHHITVMPKVFCAHMYTDFIYKQTVISGCYIDDNLYLVRSISLFVT